MSLWLKRMIVAFGIVTFSAFGLTALDKRDERSCRQDPALVAWSHVEWRSDRPEPGWDGAQNPALAPGTPGGPIVIPTGAELPPLNVLDICDGFLPW